MASRTSRQAARQQARAAFEKALDEVIPEDETRPLRGETFEEWEQQADAFDQAVTTTLLEQRVLLSESAEAEVQQLGHCPYCNSDRLYLQRSAIQQRELQTPHGPVVLGQQSVRCRACGSSFSPSAP